VHRSAVREHGVHPENSLGAATGLVEPQGVRPIFDGTYGSAEPAILQQGKATVEIAAREQAAGAVCGLEAEDDPG
jgi:hypothetical protein